MITLRYRLLGVAASATLILLLAGLPAVLATTTPTYLPAIRNLDDLGRFLASPDDGTLAWLAIWALGWLAWLALAWLIVAEITGAIRGVRPRHWRALSWPQHTVRNLVATAAMLFVATPIATALPTPVASATPIPTRPAANPAETPTAAEPEQGKPSTTKYVVKAGDSLWRIAERHLGDGERYPEIVALNGKLLHRGPDFLRVGWTLRLPERQQEVERQQPTDGYRTYTVRKGDSLSKIALKELGNAHSWPKIADASRGIVQPDGRRLIDPDQIDIGWTLHIPTGRVAEPQTPRVESDHETEQPSPASSPTPAPSVPPASPTNPPATPTVPQNSTTPSATAEPPTASESDSTADLTDDGEQMPGWMLIGLTGAGAALGGSLWMALKRHRANQFRHRRPGRTIAKPDPELIPVERSVHLAATTGAEDLVQHLDAILKSLATCLAFAERHMPALSAVHLTHEGVTLHLAEPVDELVDPWVGTGEKWHLPADQLRGSDNGEQAAPYPLLVTVGSDTDGGLWMVNPEQFGTVAITGDPQYAADLARSMAAEIAVHPWASEARVECFGIAGEVQALNPARVRHHETGGHIGSTIADVVEQVESLNDTSAPDVPTARATDAGFDVWQGRLLILVDEYRTLTEPLRKLITDQPGRTGAAVVLVSEQPDDSNRLYLDLDSDGILRVPELDLALVPAGITSDEAEGFARLIDQANTLQDAPILADPEAEVGWEQLVDHAGAIREAYTLPRSTLDDSAATATTVLPEPDDAYLETSPTTVDDLERLAPKVPTVLATAVAETDPTLDADLAEWNDPASTTPKLRVLGPISADLKGSGEPAAIAAQPAAYIELLVFLATRTRGATTSQLAEMMRIDPSRVRGRLSVLRQWLGKNPTTGEHYLPLARKSESAKRSGVATYELEGVLVDADLFRRLRLRAQSKGPDGLGDLQTALTLVTGEPLTGFQDNRGNWVYDGDRLDQQYIVAIADVAHIVATAGLQAGDLITARKAALTALIASPADETARLDYKAAGGDFDEHRLVPESPFPAEDDWPQRTRTLSGQAARPSERSRAAR